MRPILYNATETIFDSYGLGEIDANKATVTRERNGNYSLYIEYPVGGSLTPLFKQDMRIKADAGVRTKNQTFYISRIVKDSSHVIKIYAKHISHLTEHMSINHGTNRSRATAMEALRVWSSNLVGGVRFDVWSDIDTIGSIDWKLDKIKTAREALGGVEGSILDIWGGEYEFDNTTIKLHRRLGRQSPTVLEYGRNILSAEDDEDANSVYTSVYPFATYTPESQSHEEGKESKAQDPVTVTLPEKIVDSQWVGHYAERRVAVVDFSSKYGDKQTPNAESLRTFAKEYMKTNRIGIPKINTKIEYVDLAKTLDYADMSQMEEVELCDILPIYYPTIGLTNDENKVVVVNYDVLNDRNESIELGTIGQSMRSALTNSVSNRLDYLEAKQSALEETFPAYLVNAKGNKVWYRTPDNNVEHKVGDTWFEKNGQYDRIYIWNGEMWEKVIDTEDVDGIKKEFESKFQEIKKTNAEIDKKAAEALKKSGANEVLANEAKRIGLDSVAKLEEFKRKATNAQTALSGDLDALKRTIANDIRPKQVQAEVEIKKQVEALSRTKNELAGVKSAQATYEETTTRRLSELTNLANGKASKSELTQTAEELSSKIASVQAAHKNQGDRVSVIESNFKQRADALEVGVRSLTEGLRTKADISSLNVTAENIRQSVKRLETNTQDKLNQKLSLAEFEVRAGSIRQEILNATKDKADKTLVIAEAGKLREEFSKMKVGSRNYAEDYDFSRGLWSYSQGDNSPQDWTISNGEYNVKGTTNTWKQMQIHSKEGSRSSWKSSTALLDLEIGETYTLSFQGICYSGNPSVWVTLRANRTTPGNTEVIGGRFTLTSAWQTYQVTIPALTKPDNFDFWRIILGYDEIGHVAFRKVELTRSSTRIDAGPAPEDGKTDLVVAKSEFEKTAEGLSAKMTAVESYVGQDGQRQEALRRYTREESARQATAVREQVSKDYVGKNTFQESVQGVERRLESLSLGTSGNLLKNSNDGFYNQNNKKYRLVETLQANQVYTLVSKYWNGENATGHTFLDGIGNWRHLTYNSAIDAWMVQFTPTQKIPAGTEITLSSDPGGSVGNMSWATLVRGAIPLIHWQPAKGDIEEGVTHKLAEYKETVDGRFATISSQLNGKANQADFQRVKETSQLYERILGNSENGITNNVARMALTNQLFQVEVAKSLGSDNNLIVRSKSMDRHTLANEGDTKRVFVNNGIFTIRCAGNPDYTFAGFTLPLYIDRMAKGETYTLNFKYRIMGRLDHNFVVVAKNHQSNEGIFYSNIATGSTAVSSDWKEFNSTYTISKDFEFGEHKLYPLYFYLAKNGWVEIKEIMLVRASQTNGYKASQLDEMSEAVRTVQSQLAGSWAVQNINSAGDVVSQINATGSNVLVQAEKILFKGHTLAEKLSAIDGYFKRLFVGEANVGTLNVALINSNSITGDMLNMNKAFIQKLVSNNIFTNELTAQRGFIHQLQSKIINTEVLDAFRGRIGGFNLGPFPQGGGRWIAGNNPYICGMGNGEGGGVRTAFWANWGNNWNKAGWGSWVVNTDGKMYCKNEVNFYHKVDFANTCAVNFYSRPNASKGIWTGDGEINGNGSNPAGGQNAVVWWNQITTGKWRQHAGITTASDRRLKENIEPTPVKALDKINDLNLVAFDYIKDKSHEEIGLIAQEVLDVVPNAVNEYEGKDSHLTINYAKFIPYLLKAIQELNKKINLMEERYGSII